MPEKIVVLSDFDGTIVEIDTGAYLLTEFANGDWRRLEDQFESGEITFDECLRGQFGMITQTKDELLKKVDTVRIRPYVIDVVRYCRDNGIEFKITSGGLDFCIQHLLQRNKLEVEVVCPKTTFTCDGLKLDFPELRDPTSFSFKDDAVKRYHSENYFVLFVGDGYADYYALKEADLRFVIKDSVSARLLRNGKIDATEVADFGPILDEIANHRTLMRVN